MAIERYLVGLRAEEKPSVLFEGTNCAVEIYCDTPLDLSQPDLIFKIAKEIYFGQLAESNEAREYIRLRIAYRLFQGLADNFRQDDSKELEEYLTKIKEGFHHIYVPMRNFACKKTRQITNEISTQIEKCSYLWLLEDKTLYRQAKDAFNAMMNAKFDQEMKSFEGEQRQLLTDQVPIELRRSPKVKQYLDLIVEYSYFMEKIKRGEVKGQDQEGEIYKKYATGVEIARQRFEYYLNPRNHKPKSFLEEQSPKSRRPGPYNYDSDHRHKIASRGRRYI